jgi:hypothetical protein
MPDSPGHGSLVTDNVVSNFLDTCGGFWTLLGVSGIVRVCPGQNFFTLQGKDLRQILAVFFDLARNLLVFGCPKSNGNSANR